MKLLICAATELEIESTIAFLKDCNKLNQKVEVLITGIGLTAATYLLTKKIAQHKPSFVLQAGVCGSLDEELALGDVFVVEKESIGDLGVIEKGGFSSLFNLGLAQLNDPPWVNGKLYNDRLILNKTGLPIVDGVTINEITTNKQRINLYKEQLKADIETMEGAALHYVCLSEKIPFMQLRSISNYVGERNKNKWALHKAIIQLNLELQRILVKIFNL